MRVLARVIFFGALVLAVPDAVLAQHGAAPAGHAAAPASHAAHFGSLPSAHRAPIYSGYTGIEPGALRSSRGYSYGRRDFRRVPYTYFFAPYYYPYLGYADSAYGDSGYGPDYGYGYDPSADPGAQGPTMAENMLGDQVNRLTAEVDQMRYGQPMPPAPLVQQDSQPPQNPVTLVLRNGQQLKIQNYAVMDQTFWDFSTQPTLKIPISNIDIAASAKATMASGAEFPELSPGSHDAK
jgi:hypothetical protein